MPVGGHCTINAAQATGVGLDSSGHVFTAGYFQGTMTLAPGSSLTSAGSFDVFAVEFDTAGNYVTGLGLGGSNFDADFGVGVNASGQVAVAGRYTGPATFGSFTLPGQPGKAVFVAQLASSFTPPPPLAPPAPVLQAPSDTGLSSSDRITNLRSLTFDTGTIPAGNTLQLLRDGVVVASRSGGGARFDCTECHRYHHGDAPLHGIGAEERHAREPRSIEKLVTP